MVKSSRRRTGPGTALLGALLLGMLLLLAPTHVSGQPATQPDPGPVPVTKADPSWGEATAPVTLVQFADLQCPYCDRVTKTIDELKAHYGRRALRVVYKHFPLSFHKRARIAAQTGIAVWTLRGDDAFFDYQKQAYPTLRSGQPLDIVRAMGISERQVQRVINTGKPAAKVDEDVALAQQIGVTGTPAFYVNGVLLSGSQKKAAFIKVIDDQLLKARAAIAGGVPAAMLYAQMTKANFGSAAKATSRHAALAKTVWKVPVGRSPTIGSSNALVTWIVFADFACKHCKRLMPTVEQLRKTYGNKLRVVFKHNPLPFHPRADEAAELAAEVYARRGAHGFWQAVDKLFDSHPHLEDPDLERVATELGLNPRSVMRAVHKQKHRKRIDKDQELAADLDAGGTPNSFINGRRIRGTAARKVFADIIDEEIDKANALLAKGVSAQRLYAHIMKAAKPPPLPAKKTVASPSKSNPAKGSARAKVTIQMFLDFQCSHCAKVTSTLRQIEKDYGRRIRLVFRHKPGAHHGAAMLAHEAAAEAFNQAGNRTFWKIHDAIFADQGNLDRATLVAHAVRHGLDIHAFEQALDSGQHQAAIEADLDVARAAGIRGTPAFTINGYYLSGNQPYRQFKRLIDRALKGK